MIPTYGSLFSGVGGFDLGLDSAGYECRFQVEYDKHCQQVLNRHWPTVPKWNDVCDVDGNQIPPVDVLAFGSPCQDLSIAGKRAGLAGERSGLFHQAMRIVKEMRNATANQYPRIVIWENVVGALSSNNGRDFGTVLHEMAEIGSLVTEWSVLDAQHFGIPQRRRRVFVVAVLDPVAAERCSDPLLPVGESVRRDSSKGRKKGQATSGEVGGGAPVGDEPTIIGTIGPTFGSKNYSNIQEVSQGSLVAQPVSFDTQFGSNANVFADQSPTLKSTQQSPSVLGDGMIVRRLTPVECERLMGWPDDHTLLRADGKEQSDAQRYRQIGNGVASPVAKWIGKHLYPLVVGV